MGCKRTGIITFMCVILLVPVLALVMAVGVDSERPAVERQLKIKDINEQQQKMVVEDWDVIWLLDKDKGALTEWHVDVGDKAATRPADAKPKK